MATVEVETPTTVLAEEAPVEATPAAAAAAAGCYSSRRLPAASA